MRIGIDGACWLNRRGYGRFARELVASLVALDEKDEYTLVVDFDPAEAPPIPPGVSVVRAAAGRPGAQAAAASGRRSLGDMWAMSRAIGREHFDLVFFPSAYTYVPVFGAGAVVVAIHDVIAEQLGRHVFPTWRAALFWRLKLWAARQQADLVMTVSKASKKGIMQRFGIPSDRIVVVSEAADALFQPRPRDAAAESALARFGLLDAPFLLYVGGISPHKNLTALLDAFAQLRREPDLSGYRLVLVGDYSGDVFFSAYEDLRRQAAELGLGDALVFTGYVADEELVHLYNAAETFVLPSLLEGFGLPVIEAMACGTPVVVSARGALPEIVGAAGLLFDPDRRGDLAIVLRRVLRDADLRGHLANLGRQQAAGFSWQRAARDTWAAFHGLANGKGVAKCRTSFA